MNTDYQIVTIREAASLTNAYVASSTIGLTDSQLVYNNNQLILYVDFTLGALTTLSMQVQFSTDNTTWYDELVENVPTAGVTLVQPYIRTLDATTKGRIAIPVKDRYIRVRSKGNITDGTSSLSIKAMIGTA